MLFGNATECVLDSHGRVLLPPKLREFADLEKESVMSGQGNKFEIWNEGAWNSLMDESVALGFEGDLPSTLENLSI